MIECLIIGDSIGVGISQVRRECSAIVKSGINSQTWKKHNLDKIVDSKTTIISLGANDTKVVDTECHIRDIRSKITSNRVYWILPNEQLKPKAVSDVQRVASEYGDVVIHRPIQHISADKVHPTGKGYRILADKTR